MNTINRFSSRRQRLDHAFLAERLRMARSYKRIAGYFRSSIFELVGEEISTIPKVQIVCNSELDAAAAGIKTCFLGSINETKSAFSRNYEILWEDTSSEGVAWVEEEFDVLWHDAYPLLPCSCSTGRLTVKYGCCWAMRLGLAKHCHWQQVP